MKFTKIIGLLVAAGVLGGCSTGSVLIAYPNQMDKTKAYLESGTFEIAQSGLDKKRDSNDKILHMMERGRISQIARDYDGSIADFSVAIDAIQENEDKAKVTASGAVAQAGAVLTNDNAIPYAGDTYERVFVHNYQAINYVFKHDLEAAGVEVRRANMEQEAALDEFDNELADAEESEEAQGILSSNKDYMSKFNALSELAGKVKNSFQNAYTFYISGVIYEARKEYDHAYIDFKKALEIFPDNEYIVADLVRLSKKLGMKEDYDNFKQRENSDVGIAPSNGEGKLVVLYEHDYVPQKEQIKIGFHVLNKFQTLTFPTYMAAPEFYPSLKLKISGKEFGSTQEIVDVSALAAKALEERIPMILVRQAVRMIANNQTQENIGGALGLVSSLSQLLLNNADRRSWLTLPAGAQIMHGAAKSGSHNVVLSMGGVQKNIKVDVDSGRTTILHVIGVGSQLLVDSVKI